jgi:hypothetical protein
VPDTQNHSAIFLKSVELTISHTNALGDKSAIGNITDGDIAFPAREKTVRCSPPDFATLPPAYAVFSFLLPSVLFAEETNPGRL